MLNRDHATELNSHRVVRSQIALKNKEFIDEIVKWAEVFSEVMPNGKMANIIIQERLEQTLHSLTDDRSAMISALEQLKEKISQESYDFDLSGVI